MSEFRFMVERVAGHRATKLGERRDYIAQTVTETATSLSTAGGLFTQRRCSWRTQYRHRPKQLDVICTIWYDNKTKRR